MSARKVLLPCGLAVIVEAAKALWPMRGHQYTAAHHPSMCVLHVNYCVCEEYAHPCTLVHTSDDIFECRHEPNLIQLNVYYCHLPFKHHCSLLRFRTWEEFDSFTHDLAAFGTNQVELAHFHHRTHGDEIDVQALTEFSSRLDEVSCSYCDSPLPLPLAPALYLVLVFGLCVCARV